MLLFFFQYSAVLWVLSHYCPYWVWQQRCKKYLQVQVKNSLHDGAIMGYCSSVPPAWKHPGRNYPPIVVESCSISLCCLGRRNACRLKFWHMGQWIGLCDDVHVVCSSSGGTFILYCNEAIYYSVHHNSFTSCPSLG